MTWNPDPVAGTETPDPRADENPFRSVPLRDETPNLSSSHEWFIRGFALVTLAYTAYYLFWRWTQSLNPDALWFAVPLVMAESYLFITSLMLVFTVWRLRRRIPTDPPDGLSVDVFVTNYDEPLDILRRTALAARDIRYPHKTYLLDDGKRDEVQALANDLDIGYIRREGNEHAKAGNLNNALKHTDSDFILQLDADHVPLPNILHRLLGFFGDPKVAFVQSPQDFYNMDSFSHDVNEQRRRLWEEQRIFFSLIQPGKDRWNAAFFCGSCGVIRRAAMDEIGGFSTETITEDMETSLLLHARGWKSVYYGESLAFGLAPGSAGAFHVQRLRWGQGSMQILRKLNPLTYPGLTIPQRICYFNSVTSYLDGLNNLILYLAPVVFFFTGAFPIRAEDSEFLIRFLPYLVLSALMFELLSRGTGFIWISIRYNMAKFFTYVLALSGFFARGALKFNVTPKGAAEVPFRTYAPQIALIFISALSVVWAIVARKWNLIEYNIPGWGSLAIWFNFAWLALNVGLAGYVVQLSLQLKQQRSDHRFADPLPVRIGLIEDDSVTPVGAGVTENLNSGGLAFRSTFPLQPESRVEITLPLSTEAATVRGRVLRCRGSSKDASLETYAIGIAFEDVPLSVRDAIEMHCIQHAVPIWQLQYRTVMDIFTRTAEWMSEFRSERRRSMRLPAQVSLDGSVVEQDEELATLEEISHSGARLLLRQAVTPGTPITFHVVGSDIGGEGQVVYSSALTTAVGVRYAVGIRGEMRTQPAVTS